MSDTELPLLATSALEASWGTDEPLVFLGEWCRLYDRRTLWAQRRHSVVGYHWDDRAKLHADHDRLQALHGRLLDALAPALNARHSLVRPRRYWQTLLDPWLLTYVAAVWDRWECLRAAFAAHGTLRTIALADVTADGGWQDYNDFIEDILQDPWNHALCLDIVRTQYADRCRIIEHRGPAPVAGRAIAAAPTLRQRAARALDRLLGAMARRERVVLYQSYFPATALARLGLRLGQLPRSYRSEFDGTPVTAGATSRRDAALAVTFEPRDAFERFLAARLPRDIPRACVEDFAALRARAARIRLAPRAILTANAHWHHALFKVWSAEQVLQGAKLVCMEHGGGLFPALYAMSFEEDIADVKTTWTLPVHPKQRRLPPNKLAAFRLKSAGNRLAIVGCEMPRYAYRADSSPKAGQNLVGFGQVTEFCAALDAAPRDCVLVKPARDWGWNTRQRYADALGAGTVSTQTDYYRFLAGARLIVCTYPQTSFSEAMASGTPTILLYPAQFWETLPQLEGLLAELRAAGIVFHDPRAAAAQVNRIWADPAGWWASAEVARARQAFHAQALDLDGDWLGAWSGFLRELAA